MQDFDREIEGIFIDSEYTGRAAYVMKNSKPRIIVQVTANVELEYTLSEFIKDFSYTNGEEIKKADLKPFKILYCRRNRFHVFSGRYDRKKGMWVLKGEKKSMDVDRMTFAICYKPVPDIVSMEDLGSVACMKIHSGLRIICNFITKNGVYSEPIHIEPRGHVVDYRIQSKVLIKKDIDKAYKTLGNLTKAISIKVREQVSDDSNHVMGFEIFDMKTGKVYKI